MALKARITKDELSKLKPDLQAEYVADKEREGFFVPDVTPDGGFALHDSTKLQGALESERGFKKELEKSLKAFEGLDAARAREALRNEAVYKSGADERVTTLAKQHDDAIKAKEAEYGASRDALLGNVRKVIVKNAIKAAGGVPEMVLPMLLGRTKIAPRDDDFDVFVTDDKGEPVLTKVPGGHFNMPVTEHLALLRADEKFKGVFLADVKPGNGSPASGGGGNGGGPRTIARGDTKAAALNFDDIADGKVTVR